MGKQQQPTVSRRTILTIATAVAHMSAVSVLAATDVSWTNAAGGTWDTAINWSPNTAPITTANNGVIAIVPASPYSVNIVDSISPASISLKSSNATIVDSGGTLNTSTITLNAGTFQLNGGTISNAAVNIAGGSFSVFSGTLNKVSVTGADLVVPVQQALVIQNGVTVADHNLDVGGGANVYFAGNQELDNLNVNTTASQAALWLGTSVTDTTPVTLNLGTLTNSATTVSGPFEIFQRANSANDTLNNYGTISANSTGTTYVETAVFNNYGNAVTAANGTLEIDSLHFTNYGTLALGAGSTLRFIASNFTEMGTLTTSGVVVVNQSTITFASGAVHSNGTLSIIGTSAVSQPVTSTATLTGPLMVAPTSGDLGNYSIGAGTLTCQNSAIVGSNGSGTFTQTAGKTTITGNLSAGNTGTLTGGNGTGKINISGGSLYADTLLLGDTNGGTGAMTVSNTANVTIGGGAHLNDLTVNGGTVTVLNQAPPAGEDPELNRALVGGYLSNGALYVNGGNVTSPDIKLGITQGMTGTFAETAGSVTVGTFGIGNDASLTSGSGIGSATVSGGALFVNTLLLGSNVGGAGQMIVSGTGSVTIAGGAHLNDLTVNGGSVTVLAQAAPAGEDPELYQALVGGYLTNGALYVNGGIVTTPYIKLGITAGRTGTFVQTTGTVSAGTLCIGSDVTPTSGSGIGSATVSGGTLSVGTLIISSSAGGVGTFTINGTANVNVTTTINNGTINQSGGTANFGMMSGSGSEFSSSATTTATAIRQNLLSVGSGSTVTISNAGTNASTSIVNSLSLSSAGTFDLKNNDLIINNGSLNTTASQIATAYDGGKWDKPGITSSTAAATPTVFGLGYGTPAQIGTTSFDGQSGLTGTAVLVKYTLPGDTTLKGSVGLGDYNTVIANYNTGTLWTQGNFHYTGTTGLADYNSVIANYNSSVATTHALVGPVSPLGLATARTNLVALSTSPASPSLTLNAQLASDLRLEVNTASGDVSMLNTSGAAVSFTGYNIYDPSNNIQDSNNDAAGDPANEKLLSVASTAGGNTTPYRSSTNYRLWSVVKDNANTLSEGENNSRYVAGTATTYDTIVIPTGGSIDFGLVFGTGNERAGPHIPVLGTQRIDW